MKSKLKAFLLLAFCMYVSAVYAEPSWYLWADNDFANYKKHTELTVCGQVKSIGGDKAVYYNLGADYPHQDFYIRVHSPLTHQEIEQKVLNKILCATGYLRFTKKFDENGNFIRRENYFIFHDWEDFKNRSHYFRFPNQS